MFQKQESFWRRTKIPVTSICKMCGRRKTLFLSSEHDADAALISPGRALTCARFVRRHHINRCSLTSCTRSTGLGFLMSRIQVLSSTASQDMLSWYIANYVQDLAEFGRIVGGIKKLCALWRSRLLSCCSVLSQEIDPSFNGWAT